MWKQSFVYWKAKVGDASVCFQLQSLPGFSPVPGRFPVRLKKEKPLKRLCTVRSAFTWLKAGVNETFKLNHYFKIDLSSICVFHVNLWLNCC